jgi:hypothetical protein
MKVKFFNIQIQCVENDVAGVICFSTPFAEVMEIG